MKKSEISCPFCFKQMSLTYFAYQCNCNASYKEAEDHSANQFKINDYIIINDKIGFSIFFKFDEAGEKNYHGKGNVPFLKTEEEIKNYLLLL